MAEENKPKSSETEQEISRRSFFTKMGLGSLGIASAGTLAFAYQFLSPTVLYAASPIVNAGQAASAEVNSVTLHG